MPDWAIVLLAAFGGGLAGAVLQPVVSYLLERIRSGEEIRKRRERSLRRMLTTHMVWGRHSMALSLNASVHRQRGTPLTSSQIYTEPDKIANMLVEMPGVAWRPERIEDRTLSDAASAYHAAVVRLDSTLPQPQDHIREARELEDRLDELEHQIIRRMDELNWPEVDD